MMHAPRAWKDKLPSIAGTLAMQAAFAALLLFSVTAVRQAVPPVETVFLLPKPKPEPIVIDARQPPKPMEEEQMPAGAIAEPPSQLPAYAAPGQTLNGSRLEGSALLRALVQDFHACRKKEGEDRPVCPGGIAPADPRIVKFEDRAVKGSDTWQADVDRRNAPFALPGAGAGPLGILITALTNPSAYSDPKAYGIVRGGSERVSGAEALQRRRYNNPNTSLNGTDYENRVRLDSAGALNYGD